MTGLEPATCSLRMSCTTSCATQANINFRDKTCTLSVRNKTYCLHTLHYFLFLSFANSLYLPLTAVICSANPLTCQLYSTRIHTEMIHIFASTTLVLYTKVRKKSSPCTLFMQSNRKKDLLTEVLLRIHLFCSFKILIIAVPLKEAGINKEL